MSIILSFFIFKIFKKLKLEIVDAGMILYHKEIGII